jgi:invasin B
VNDTVGVGAAAHASSVWTPAFARQGSAPGIEQQAETVTRMPTTLLGAMQQGAERVAIEWEATLARLAQGTDPLQDPARLSSSTSPTLAEPPGYRESASAREAGNPGARLLQSMLELEALVNASSLDTIRSRLAALTARHEALKAQCELAGKEFSAALTTAEEASRQALQAQAAAIASGGKPDVAAFDAAVDRALETERALQSALDEMNEAVAFQVPELDVSKLQTNASRLTELLASLQELLSKSNTDAFRARSEFLSEMAQVRREAALREAVEVERQLRKQERLNRLFGWLGRAFGWVLTALSFAAALFTGGASLVVAGVMLGLMVTDQIVSATTGVSPMAEAFQAVLSPLVQALAEVFEKMMLGLGVDAATAKLVATVLASIAAIVVVIAVTVVGVKIAGRLIGPLVSKLASGLTSGLASGTARIVPTAITRAAQQGSAALGKLGTQIRARVPGGSAHAHVHGVRIVQAANAGQFGVAAMTAGGQIAVASLQLKASKAAANFVVLDHSARVLQQMIDELLGTYAEGLQTLRAMMTMSAEALENEAQTGRFIMRGMHRAM